MDRQLGDASLFLRLAEALLQALLTATEGGAGMPCRRALKRVWIPMTKAQHRRLHALIPGVRTLWDEPGTWEAWHAFLQALPEVDKGADDDE